MKTRKQAQRAEMPNDNARGLDHAASGAVLEIGRLQANPEAVLLTSTQIAAKLNVPPSWIREKTRKRALKDALLLRCFGAPHRISPRGKFCETEG